MSLFGVVMGLRAPCPVMVACTLSGDGCVHLVRRWLRAPCPVMVACTLSGDGCVHLVRRWLRAPCPEMVACTLSTCVLLSVQNSTLPSMDWMQICLPYQCPRPQPLMWLALLIHIVPTIRVCMNGARILVGFDLRIHTNADYF